jgi:hypothetical protein
LAQTGCGPISLEIHSPRSQAGFAKPFGILPWPGFLGSGKQLPRFNRVFIGMKALSFAAIALSCFLVCASAAAQNSSDAQDAPLLASQASHGVAASGTAAPDLDWMPPAFAQLSAQATSRTSFTLDRNTLGMAAALVPQSEADARNAIAKLDGVSVHMLRFSPTGIADASSVKAIREAYRLRGWKHVVSNTALDTASVHSGSAPRFPLRSGTTDVWFQLDGSNVRQAVILAETPQSLALVTLSGNISPVDLLHLRGHFGIPRFDGDQFRNAGDK